MGVRDKFEEKTANNCTKRAYPDVILIFNIPLSCGITISVIMQA